MDESTSSYSNSGGFVSQLNSSQLHSSAFSSVLVLLSEGNIVGEVDLSENKHVNDQPNHIKLYKCEGLCVEEITNLIYPPDPFLTFFRQEMGWNDDQISRHHVDALAFFRDAFGFDFTKGYNVNGILTIPGVMLRPYTSNSSVHNMILSGGNINSLVAGGYLIKVVAPGVLARGAYGGAIGKPLPIESILLYGYFSTVHSSSSPLSTSIQQPLSASIQQPLQPLPMTQSTSIQQQWFHIHSLEPIQQSLLKAWTIQSEIIAFGSESWGRLDGISSLVQSAANKDYHLSVRHVATFPGRL